MSFFLGLMWMGTAAAVPGQYTHQGRVLDADGAGLDADVEMAFRMMSAVSGGDTVWEEVLDVSLNNGFYSVVLGSDEDDNPLDLEVLDLAPLWLEVQITASPAMVPRQPLHSVPYATLSGAAEEVVGGPVDASVVAIGGEVVIDEDGVWVGETPAVGWLDISGVPEGLADGVDDDTDTDSFADLGVSCVDGDVPRWDGLSGAWACDLDDDSLADLACTDGQLAAWSETAAAWSCTDDAVLSGTDVLGFVEGADLALGGGTTLGGQTPRYADTPITWGEIEDMPDDFADGIDDDEDALASISCSGGAVLVYTAGTGWACGTDTDTTLTTDEVQAAIEGLAGISLGAATTIGGQAARLSGESIPWADISDPPSGFTDGDDDTLSDLDCEEGQLAIRQSGAWVCSDLASVFDEDGDGSMSWADCDDTDASRYPGATETWYDGEDSDCGEDSDYDADGDGYDHQEYGGIDCDDSNPAVFASGDSASCPADSCVDILRTGTHTDNGYYWVQPSSVAAFQVYCDLSTADGGWALAAVINGDSGAHANTGAVGEIGYPSDSTSAKLADSQINALSNWEGSSENSIYMLTCNGETDYIKYQIGWSSTATNEDANFTYHYTCGNYACVTSDSWTHYTGGTSSSDEGGGSYPNHDAIQYRADYQTGCYNEGYHRSGLLWVR